MNTKELKTRILRGMIRKEYFYIPLHGAGPAPPSSDFIYRVNSVSVAISFNQYYYRYALRDEIDAEEHTEYHYYTSDRRPVVLDCTIDWGDGTTTTIDTSAGVGTVDDNGTVTEYDGDETGYFTRLAHEYTDGETVHTITIRGKVSHMSLGGYPIAIINWGNLHMDTINGLVYGSTSSPCYQRFSIPNAPATGMQDITTVNNMFYQTALTAVPDGFFTGFTNLIYAYGAIYYAPQLRTIGNNVFQGLTSLAYASYIIAYCGNLTTIGDCMFDGCVSLGAYPGRINVDESAFTGPDYTRMVVNMGANAWRYIMYGCPITTIGDYMFRGCGFMSHIPINAAKAVIRSSDYSTSWFSTLFFGYITNANNGNYKKVTIGRGTFKNCSELKFIDYFFYGTNVTYFPADTFEGCGNIVSGSFAFGEMFCPFNAGAGVFDDMENLISVTRWTSSTQLQSVPKFPNSPIEYMQWAFYHGTTHTTQSAITVDGQTVLPDVSGQNTIYIGNSSIPAGGDVNDYITVFHWHALDVTDVLNADLINIKSAQGAFYCPDMLDREEDDTTRHYSNLWVGSMPNWWSAMYAAGNYDAGDALVGCLGIDEFDDVTVDEQAAMHILEYSKYGEYLSMTNTEFARYCGERLVTEW